MHFFTRHHPDLGGANPNPTSASTAKGVLLQLWVLSQQPKGEAIQLADNGSGSCLMRCEPIFLLGGKWRGTISLSAGPMYLSFYMLSMGHMMPCSQMAYERTGNAHFLLERNIVQFLQQAEYTGPSRTPLPSSQGCSHSAVLKLAVSGDLAPRALGLNLQCRGTWGLVSTRDGCFFSSASRRRHTSEPVSSGKLPHLCCCFHHIHPFMRG